MAFNYYRSVTVDHTKVQSADQTNFPVLITGTLTYLKTVGNGGKVQNSSGFDIVFCTNPANITGTYLDWEMVNYDATSGLFEAYIRVPTLTTGTDYVFYIAYGNTGISTFQGNVVGTWNSSYQAVYHFKDGTTLTLTDSTTNAVNGTNNSATATTGQTDGGIALSGSSQYVNLGNKLGIIGDLTIEAWLKPTDFTGFNGVLSKTAGSQPKPYDFYLTAATGLPVLFVGDGAGASGSLTASGAPTTGVFNYVVVTKTGTSTVTIAHYLNGATNGSGTAPGVPNPLVNGSDNAYIGTRGDFVTMFKGSMDEMRVSNVVLTDNWKKTTYNNINSPSTFTTIGSEVGATNSGFFRLMM